MNDLPKWGQRVLIVAGVLLFAYLLVALGLQSQSVAKVVGNPTTCGTCHYMESQAASYQQSEHKDVGCLGCHSSPDFLTRPIDEVRVSSRHIAVTLAKTEPLSPQLSAAEQADMQLNCYNCHKAEVQNLHQDKLGDCTSCHRLTPHDRPNLAGQ